MQLRNRRVTRGQKNIPLIEEIILSEESELEWKFQSEGSDIGFGVQKKLAERFSNFKSKFRRPKNTLQDGFIMIFIILNHDFKFQHSKNSLQGGFS